MENEELLNEIRALRQELDGLKKTVYEDIIGPIEKDWNDKKYNEAVEAWKNKYKERLSPYEDRLRATEDDGFDLWKSTYDEWNKTEDDPDEWVDVLIEELDKTLEPLAKAFGTPVEKLNADIKIENGEVTDVVADTEPESTEGEEGEVAEEEVKEEEPSKEGGEEELSEEEQFQKELDDAYAKMSKGRGY